MFHILIVILLIIILSSQGKIHHLLFKLKKNHQKIMATLEELNAKADALQASVDAKQAAIAAAIADLQAQIAAGSGATAEQLQGVVDKLSATQADVDSTPTA